MSETSDALHGDGQAGAAPIVADSLNRGCTCRTLDAEQLRLRLETEPALAGLYDEIARTRPHLFSATAVFISPQQVQHMADIIAAVESVVSLPAYREAVLARAPAIARTGHGPKGVFMGYDFHLGVHGPRLIEINTNAGGALLNAILAGAQRACCREMELAFTPGTGLASLEQDWFAMFVAEWRSQRGTAPLACIAIVDDEPSVQYLHPEFQLFMRMFRKHGVDAMIADARELAWHDGKLWHAGQAVDLVYNRLTDFYLDEERHAALRAAYESGAAVVTPHPRVHALYADKRNLVILSDGGRLDELGVAEPVRAALLAGVPRTVLVTPERADELWAQRRSWFFKPVAGYGSKAAYRGDKLTRRVWEEILASDYVAQTLAPPSERLIKVDGKETGLKLDVRVYTYDGAIQLVAARLYSGQTTNFRTPGGGFAPVFVVNDDAVAGRGGRALL
ncbi:MAG: hypothetical protein AB1513_03170 [Pseudomonadota bacterium]